MTIFEIITQISLDFFPYSQKFWEKKKLSERFSKFSKTYYDKLCQEKNFEKKIYKKIFENFRIFLQNVVGICVMLICVIALRDI